jgi:cyclase
MTDFNDRRGFLRAMAGSAVGAALWPAARTHARSSSVPLVPTELSEDLILISGAGANVVAARGPDGALLVDGGTQERSAELLKLVGKELSTRRVQTLFNTHWHPEQTGSNARLSNDRVRIIAHENTKLWLGYELEVPLQNRTYGPLPPKARPNDTIYATGSLQLGGEQVDYGYLLQAHTDGDIYVFFRKANVLVGGGAVSADRWPIIDWRTGGWIGGLVDGLRSLVALCDDKTRIVPANGPVLTRADLQAQREMYAGIQDRLQKSLRKGLGPEETVASAPTQGLHPEWGDPTDFVTLAFKSLWGHLAPDA